MDQLIGRTPRERRSALLVVVALPGSCADHAGVRDCGLCGKHAAPIGLTVCVECGVGVVAERAVRRQGAA